MIEPSAYCVAALLILGVLGVCTARIDSLRSLIYPACGLVCLTLLVIGVLSLSPEVTRMRLPLGLPWIGVNLRLDALAGAFLVLIGLGGAGASLYAIGYERHETEPGRIVPFFPAFIAGMTCNAPFAGDTLTAH